MSNKDQEGFYRGTRRYVIILLAAAPLFALSRCVRLACPFVLVEPTAGRLNMHAPVALSSGITATPLPVLWVFKGVVGVSNLCPPVLSIF